ncbi:EamA family transporter [Pseudohalocynthiibacter aestuariivivens]|nr:DMT family transporter [Pseudohalocynthiibacter aestuariivivens]QIE46785.1 EamA family transporter [Pseudohalocynthiibacter aestuariivivens]
MTATTDTARHAGIALMLGSAMLFSTAGLFTKGVEASAWQVIFWRGVFSAVLTFGAIALRGHWRREVMQMGWRGLLIAAIGATATAAFLSAFKMTSVANVALIYSASPLVAAVLAWWVIREAPGRMMVLGAAIGMVGIAVIMGGGVGHGHLAGDLLALTMALGLALLFVLYRVWPDVPAAGPTALSSVLLLPVAGLMAPPLEVSSAEIGILACFGLVFALASVMMLNAAKRLPSGQAGLLSTAETPFAILLAWLILSEVPVVATWIGGALVMGGVILGGLARASDQPGSVPSTT